MTYALNPLACGKDAFASSGAIFERGSPLLRHSGPACRSNYRERRPCSSRRATAAFLMGSALGLGTWRARLDTAADTLEAEVQQFPEAMRAGIGVTADWWIQRAGRRDHVARSRVTHYPGKRRPRGRI